MTQEDAPGRLPAQAVPDFAEMEPEFMRRVARIVWCTVATVDRKGRPRTRILHPIWEIVDGAPVGYIATGRQSHKEKHLARNPYVSLTYWDPAHEQVYVDAKSEWADAPAERQRIWDLYKNTPPPLGYDPGMIWQNGPLADDFGVMRLSPWRVELWSLGALMQQKAPQIWRG
jgi:general stress protein 26